MKHFNRLFILGAALIVSTAINAAFIPNAWINEIHYDNSGTDVNEGVEVVIENADTLDLSKFEIVLYNGNDGKKYNTSTLDGITPSASDNFKVYWKLISGIQNGAPDGVALAYRGTLIQFLSYEGKFTAIDGIATGIESTDIGVLQSGSEAAGLTLQLSGAGTAYGNFTWQTSATGTPGLVNTGQNLGIISNFYPVISNIAYAPVYVQSTTAVNISAEVTDADGTITQVGLVWGTDKDVLTNPILMTNGGSGNIYTSIAPIPAQANGTTVYFALAAVDNEPDTTLTSPQSYTVFDPKTATLPYTQEFSADLGDFYTYSASGNTKKWGFSNGYALMNGYNSGELERDFLITPAFDFTSTQNEVISFKSWKRFGTGDNTDKYLKLMYSTDYAGIGDATAATWTEVPGVTMATDLQVWTKTEDIDVSMVTGSKIHFAFVYNYAADYVQWQVDSVVVKENVPTSMAKNHAFATIVNTVVSNNLIIQSENAVQLRIYNLAGREVKSVDYAKGEVSLSSLPKGIYIVKLTQGNNFITRRISKQ